MKIYRQHVLIPIDDESIQAGVFEVKRRLKSAIKEKGLENEVKLLDTGGFGIQGRGVVLIVYPERVVYKNIKPEDVSRIVEEHFLKGRVVKNLTMRKFPENLDLKVRPYGLVEEQKRIVLSRVDKIDPESIDEAIALGAYEALERIFSDKLSPEDVIEEVKKSGLRGRGGAAFPTGMKWEFARKAEGSPKYVICNADEGEPGTFKDRLILEGDPHKLIEGMIIAGYAIGAEKGYIYIRGEYKLSIERVEKAISQAKEYGLLGDNILESEFSFDIEVKKGAGAYVCGEETALINSLEGKRGKPRNKPPYPVTHGLWNKPTVVNNVETLANIPAIIKNGGEWFNEIGLDKCPATVDYDKEHKIEYPVQMINRCAGTKVYTILGSVEFPGLIEVEMGTTLKDIIFKYGGGIKGGKKFKGALVGGAAGAFLSPNLLEVKMSFYSLKEYRAVLGSGAILVFDEDTCVVDMLYSILKFFRHESCGFCVPCRTGTEMLLQLIYKIRKGEGEEKDIDTMLEIVEIMRSSAFCPLGQSVYLPVKSAIENYKDEFLAHTKKDFSCNKCRN